MSEQDALAPPWTMEPASTIPGLWNVYDNEGNPIVSLETAEVASLIHAAPDLLAACSQMVNDHAYLGYISIESIEQTEDAIAKATSND